MTCVRKQDSIPCQNSEDYYDNEKPAATESPDASSEDSECPETVFRTVSPLQFSLGRVSVLLKNEN